MADEGNDAGCANLDRLSKAVRPMNLNDRPDLGETLDVTTF